MEQIRAGFDDKMKSVYKVGQALCVEGEGRSEVWLRLGSMLGGEGERGGAFRGMSLRFPDSKGGRGGVC